MILSLYSLTVLLACLSTSSALQEPIASDTPLSSLISSAKAHLSNGSPREALTYFDAAVARDPTNYLALFQRGATYLSLGRNSQAVEDFDRVLKLKPDFEGALIQRARVKTKTADWTGAKGDLETAGKKKSPEYEELEEAQAATLLAEEAERKSNWDSCVEQANVAIMKASLAPSLRQTRAHCRFERGEIREALSDLGHYLQLAPGSVEPHLQISKTLFYALGETDPGVSQVRKCLHSDPDSKPCSRLFRREKQLVKRLDKLQDAMEKRKFNNAANLIVGTSGESGLLEDVKEDVKEAREAGHIHPKAPSNLYMSLVQSACEAYRAMHQTKKAKPYCSESLGLDPQSLHGLLFKAETELDEESFEDAIRTLNKAKEHHPGSNEVQSLLQKAHTLLKRSKSKDYYKVLGVSRDADERTIKHAYRQLTKEHHPDKAKSKGVTKEEAEKKMAAINEAYEVLSNPELKARFDNGDDPNDPESGRQNPFQQGNPFAGGGRQQFFFQQGHGGPQFKFSGQGFNFPGGFPFG
ncbi:hypothetical protein DTO169E5_6591 [Paecilomyces variotii]|nr:hypothetical protein DTO169E5_6591 [Paecilomyces variotii]